MLRIGIPNENHDDTEQISDTINLVDGYRLRTNDVVRATCIRGVRATAVCVISNTEYTRSISTTSNAVRLETAHYVYDTQQWYETCRILLVATYRYSK